LADYTGTTLYTVSRTLSGWEKSGWIKSGCERITVTDPHALVTFAEKG
jgi:CRP-like cAMP-binding protein